MQSTLSRSTPQPAYWLSSESYQACPAALFLMPQLVGSHGQASVVSAASWALKAELARGRLRSTEARGMPRTMWIPNLRPCAWTHAPKTLKLVSSMVAGSLTVAVTPLWTGGGAVLETEDGNLAGTGT